MQTDRHAGTDMQTGRDMQTTGRLTDRLDRGRQTSRDMQKIDRDRQTKPCIQTGRQTEGKNIPLR